MIGNPKTSTKSWTAFDLNVLRRIRFNSVAMPFTEKPALGHYLKRLDIRVTANDALLTAVTRAAAQIVNDGERLNEADLAIILEDAYVPGYKLTNPALGEWFRETDAWWFDNVRRNIDRLSTPMKRAIASSVAVATGEYAMAFDGPERELRQPLSTAFRRLWSIQPDPFANGQVNTCSHKPADDFIAESHADLMFLRLPVAHATTLKAHLGRDAWSEEWIRGGSDFWDDVDVSLTGKLGSATETKSQYLHLLEELLRRASHIRRWAIAHVESGFIQTQDIVDTIAATRAVDTIYTKDFSELTGTKAVIITA